MSKFFKELLTGFRWVLISITVLVGLVASWIGCAWLLGWLVERYFDLQNFGPDDFIVFGSGVLVFTLLIQIVTIIITIWALLAWGRSQGLVKKKEVA